MTTCEQMEPLVVEALTDEITPDRQRTLDAHLATCPRCVAELESLRRTQQAMDERVRPEPDARATEGLRTRILDAVGAGTRDGSTPTGAATSSWWSGAWPGRLSAAAALVLLGIVIGRLSAPAPPPLVADLNRPAPPVVLPSTPSTPVADPLEADPVHARVRTYIDRSQTLLVGLVNLDPEADGFEAFDLAPHRALSEALAREAVDIERDLANAGERRLARLVLELQGTLLEIAALEIDGRTEGLRDLRQRVDDRALLFKIALERGRRDGGSEASDDATAADRI